MRNGRGSPDQWIESPSPPPPPHLLGLKQLINKEGVWKSDDLWNFKTKDDDLIYVENTSETKILGATSGGKVILEDFEEDKAQQLWKKGELDAEGYYTLENSGLPKVLTAISESGLVIKGNIHNSEMNITSKLFVDYLPWCFFTHRSIYVWVHFCNS